MTQTAPKAPTYSFHKELFNWDGMYLTYGNNSSDTVFIARFKYGKKPYKRWINFLCNNFTVAEYKELSEATSPREAMESKGYFDEVTVSYLQAKLETRDNRIAELQKQLQEATK